MLGAFRAGAFLGVYMASWAYAEVVLLAVAVESLGVKAHVASGILGVAGLAASGLGLLFLSRLGVARVAPVLAPLPALAYAVLLLGLDPLAMAPLYPLMAVAAAIVASAVVGFALDTSDPDSWPSLVASMRVSASLARGAVLAGILLVGAPLVPALAGLAGVPVVYAAVTAPLVVSMRRIHKLSLLVDDLYWAIATGYPRSTRVGLAPVLAAALVGAGLAAGARYQLAPVVGSLTHEERLYALALYALAYSAGSALAAAAPALSLAAGAGALAAAGHAILDPVEAHALAGLALGYSETAIAVLVLRSAPTALAHYTGLALLAAALGVLAYSATPTPLPLALASVAAFAYYIASPRRRWD